MTGVYGAGEINENGIIVKVFLIFFTAEDESFV